MIGKCACSLLVIVFAFCHTFSSLSAQEDVGNLKKKFKDVRQEMVKAANIYKQELAKIKKGNAKKLYALKKEFHKTRAQYMAEGKSKEGQLLKDYNEKMDPLKAREEELQNMIEPKQTTNFVKRK